MRKIGPQAVYFSVYIISHVIFYILPAFPSPVCIISLIFFKGATCFLPHYYKISHLITQSFVFSTVNGMDYQLPFKSRQNVSKQNDHAMAHFGVLNTTTTPERDPPPPPPRRPTQTLHIDHSVTMKWTYISFYISYVFKCSVQKC